MMALIQSVLVVLVELVGAGAGDGRGAGTGDGQLWRRHYCIVSTVFHAFLRIFPHVTYLSSNYLLFLGFLYDF